MHKAFDKLKRNPIEVVPDPSFLFVTRRIAGPWPGCATECAVTTLRSKRSTELQTPVDATRSDYA